MSQSYLQRVLEMLGDPQARYRDAAAWSALEADLGVVLPADYKKIVDAYAPVLVNGHLYLSHPATERWNLGDSIRRTSESWSKVVWEEGEPEGDPRVSLDVDELTFGTSEGLIPLASTDRGETLFYAPRGAQRNGSWFVEDGEGEFFEYTMGFAEWLYRWLVGEDVAGPNSSAFYPGPVALQGLPMAPGERPETRYGPDRGM
ncbi:SMI1/KNR4 family protein [Streptomyces sp. KM273126]|uniref:SMI1/KNR4 family protein n=1 Tax=Streptomyces sp. KM273126 TaxID=2545247 RepID=UPI00215DB312|nr:SMI1/KNR4 family protein [Streptomyces sp. KM273126]